MSDTRNPLDVDTGKISRDITNASWRRHLNLRNGLITAVIIALVLCVGMFTGLDKKIVDWLNDGSPEEELVDNDAEEATRDELADNSEPEMEVETPAAAPVRKKRVLSLVEKTADGQLRHKQPFQTIDARGREVSGYAFAVHNPDSKLGQRDPTGKDPESYEWIVVTGINLTQVCTDASGKLLPGTSVSPVNQCGNFFGASPMNTMEVLVSDEGLRKLEEPDPEDPFTEEYILDNDDIRDVLHERARPLKDEALKGVSVRCDATGRRPNKGTGYPGACRKADPVAVATAAATP
jgi:hypothetical protein